MRFKLHVDVYKIGAVFGSKHMCMYTILYLPQIVTVQCYYIAIALHVGENLDDHAIDIYAVQCRRALHFKDINLLVGRVCLVWR